jgi:SAM-dependent methyltransferase
MLRRNPRLDNESLEECYKNEYRDLYMGPEYENMDTYFKKMIERGREIVDIVKRQSQLDLRGLDVLEIGCSVGGILVPFLESGSSVQGFDYDSRYLDYGNKYNPALNLRLGGIDSLKSETIKYDLILINHVLEHLPDPEYALQLIQGSLKANGTVYVSVPGLKNPIYYFSPSQSFLGSLHIAHLYHFTEASLIQLFHDFSVIYIDDDIRSLFRVNKKRGINKNNSVTSEYDDNIAFILQHEKSFDRKVWWAKLFLKNLLNLLIY